MKLLIDIPEHIYEHAKETTEDSRDEFDAMRAIANGTQQESSSENPNTCGDAVSRAIVQEEITKSIELKENPYQLWYRIQALPSVTPQPCGDAISRQAAISAIEALQLPIMREASTCYQFKFSGMSEAKEAVENLPSISPQQRTLSSSENPNKWIPVSERLPEVGSEVLVCFDFKGRRSVYISDFYGDGEFHGLDDEYLTPEGRKYRKAVAWMPLPQSYQGEENG